jgi:DNA polymerase I
MNRYNQFVDFMSDNILYLFDGTALAYRSYFAMINSNLRNAEGLPTGAVYAFAHAIDRIIETHKPTHIAVAWDTHAPTFRHHMDDAYKANRPPQPEELRESIPLIKEMLGYFNIPSLELDGFEADDIVGTLAESARGQNVQVFMVTPDKDFMQLVHDNIAMMKPLSKGDGFEIIDRQGVINFFGVPPEQVVDVLTLIGDSSDNIPGVSGVGKKGAPELILQYGSVDKLLAAGPSITAKRVREGILGNEDRIRLSRDMIIIKTDVPGIGSWQEMQWTGVNRELLLPFFNRMQFRTLHRKYAGPAITAPSDASQNDLFAAQSDLFSAEAVLPVSSYKQLDRSSVDYRLVTSSDELKGLLKAIGESDAICVDTETTGVDPMLAELVGIALSVKAGQAWYIALNHATFSTAEALDALRPFLSDPNRLIIAQNLKYDYIVLQRAGLPLSDNVFDTMIAGYLADPSQALNMDALAMKYLGYEPISIDQLIGSGRKQKSIADVPVDDVLYYAAEDADITYQLWEKLRETLKQDELVEVAETIEFPLVTVLARMELQGIRIDPDMLSSFSKVLGEDMLILEKKIYELAGGEFNINSPAQLGEILFKKLKLPSGKKTATGKFSTNEAVLSELAVKYELPARILDYRGLAKLRSTYVDALPPLVHPQTGRVHTSFNQSVAATGRLSSSNPNLQNIPIRTERGREIRKAFVPADGFRMVAADYSQIELRVIASMSQDEAMMEAFRNDEDIHTRTAKEIFSLDDISTVDREQRRKAKEVNFGIPYGVSAYGLASRLGIGNNEGKEIIDAYFARFPGIKTYIDETIAFAREYGYVKTMSGRRRYIPDIRSSNFNIRGFAERTAINMPVQGSAADMIKKAMIAIDRLLREGRYRTRMLLQVHDELVFEMPEAEVATVLPQIRRAMESAIPLTVPVKVESGVADNWLEAH